MAERIKLAIFISGRGSNMQALAAACAEEKFAADVGVVISNKESAHGVTKARELGLPVEIVSHKGKDASTFETELQAVCERYEVDMICLAGFTRVLSADFINKWPQRILNIHPSLLPAFPGLHAHRDVLASGALFSGCTVHFVSPEVDNGPILVQGVVPVLNDDTEEILAARILEIEHEIYPRAVQVVAAGNYHVTGKRVQVDTGHDETMMMGMVNPDIPGF